MVKVVLFFSYIYEITNGRQMLLLQIIIWIHVQIFLHSVKNNEIILIIIIIT